MVLFTLFLFFDWLMEDSWFWAAMFLGVGYAEFLRLSYV